MNRYEFCRMLGETVWRIDGAYDVFSKNAGISPSMLWFIPALNDGEKHTQSQICWDWNYPRTTANTLVKELEGDGHVVLHPVPGARWEPYVELTDSGKAYANRVLQPVFDAEEQLFAKYFENRDSSFAVQLNRFSNDEAVFHYRKLRGNECG